MALLLELPVWVIYPLLFVGFFIGFYFYLIILFRKGQVMARGSFYPAITFIVPAKNVQATLKKCIDSVMAQDYAGSILTMIVNDASTDNTLKIAHGLARAYNSKKRGVIVLNKIKSQGIKAPVVNYGLRYFFSKGAGTPLVATLDADTF